MREIKTRDLVKNSFQRAIQK